MDILEIRLLNSVRDALKKDSVRIPAFIDHTKVLDKSCMILAQIIIGDILYSAVKWDILPSVSLITKALEINSLFSEMVDISPNISLLYLDYINLLMDEYSNLFIANEMFECVQNFKELKKLLNK